MYSVESKFSKSTGVSDILFPAKLYIPICTVTEISCGLVCCPESLTKWATESHGRVAIPLLPISVGLCHACMSDSHGKSFGRAKHSRYGNKSGWYRETLNMNTYSWRLIANPSIDLEISFFFSVVVVEVSDCEFWVFTVTSHRWRKGRDFSSPYALSALRIWL